ncbi:sugar phosphate isomerase/epimerase family protein [Zhihengliuella flava]|uniref:Sugar phosphate isomerase/epimerase n=1 Tax=Zhihengliuella flava TaxID=1285193 RepID=A0A931GF59_9MICC|nr:sugar phosphate isomerase/epimerase family protein [Zhihengliuella flava]MBG6084302.1 sugar phosphate isomerase/epimerase [Zhihengliuella flava]
MTWDFAVSTLGMPGRPVAESAVRAAEHGCTGIELRVHPDEELHLEASPGARRRVKDDVARAGLRIAALAGYARICGPDPGVEEDLRRLIDLAVDVGAPAVRVFPGGERGDTARGIERIAAVRAELASAGVQLLVETHDSHPRVADVMELVEPFADPGCVGVLWDAVHPWLAGESPAVSRERAGEYLGYFQVKDLAAKERVPAIPGHGDLPLHAFRAELATWSGWVSLEWELAWHPQIGPVDPALDAARAWIEGPWAGPHPLHVEETP